MEVACESVHSSCHMPYHMCHAWNIAASLGGLREAIEVDSSFSLAKTLRCSFLTLRNRRGHQLELMEIKFARLNLRVLVT